MNPTDQQLSILSEAETGAHLMIQARAGCGKSTTLVMIAKRLAPRRVIALAFNKSAQEDLQAKIEAEEALNAKALTFNSLGHRSLSNRRLSLNTRKPYLLLDDLAKARNLSFSRAETSDLIHLLNGARNLGLVPPSKGGSPLVPWTEESWLSLFESLEIDPSSLYLESAQSLLEMSITRASSGLIDYLDQLYHPAVWGGNFPYADAYLVDEAQDLNPLQHRILTLLPTKQIIAVGDDRQAIYAFRGAYSDSMERLQSELTRLAIGRNTGPAEVKVFPLSRTWRCARSIVERQQHLVPEFNSAKDAEGLILDWTDGPWSLDQIESGWAILCRNNAPLLSLALKLLAKGRKVKILGREFAERLLRDISKAVGDKAPSTTPLSKVLESLERLYQSKAKNAQKILTQHEAERIDALRAIAESRAVNSLGDLRLLLQQIFSDQVAEITLSTGHKAKGLEWPTVLHLNPSLIPSKWSKTEEDRIQEANIRYVIETRPMNTLILAELEDLEV